ncbi:MAG TPA: hypothetical protein VMZ52_10300, partial [Bryobacteraceae bacterium]|nr:hypothetical protein [Bryobacteraceae bacterium]
MVLCFTACLAAAVPTPREHFGFSPGEDYKLADYGQIFGYYQKLARSSDRIRLVDAGKSSEGKPMFLAILSSPENLRNLERYREINRKLALGLASRSEAAKLSS